MSCFCNQCCSSSSNTIISKGPLIDWETKIRNPPKVCPRTSTSATSAFAITTPAQLSTRLPPCLVFSIAKAGPDNFPPDHWYSFGHFSALKFARNSLLFAGTCSRNAASFKSTNAIKAASPEGPNEGRRII